MPKVKLSKRIVERRKGQPKIQQQSKAKRGYSINMDTSEAVKKSPEVEHVVKKNQNVFRNQVQFKILLVMVNCEVQATGKNAKNITNI